MTLIKKKKISKQTHTHHHGITARVKLSYLNVARDCLCPGYKSKHANSPKYRSN